MRRILDWTSAAYGVPQVLEIKEEVLWKTRSLNMGNYALADQNDALAIRPSKRT
jgi:hypothetical protein